MAAKTVAGSCIDLFWNRSFSLDASLFPWRVPGAEHLRQRLSRHIYAREFTLARARALRGAFQRRNVLFAGPGVMQSFDIAVVGAGIAGARLSRRVLTRAGKRVVLLLEMESQAGYHTTGRSAAIFAPSLRPCGDPRPCPRLPVVLSKLPPEGV